MKQPYALLALLYFFVAFGDMKHPVRMYALYTPSHAVMLNEWFLPSIKDDYEVIVRKAPQECESAEFFSKNWKKTTLAKVNMIIEAIEKNWGHWFVYSDVDITFYQKTRPILENVMETHDIAIQIISPKTKALCTGFFACKANQRMLDHWKKVRHYMQTIAQESDQAAFNHVLLKDRNPYNITYYPLSNKEFMSGGNITAQRWKPGQDIPVPQEMVLHHANWTVGIPNKIKQLEYVRSQYERYRKGSKARETLS